MKIGCHVSSSKGFHHAAKQAVILGAQAFQVFTKNPRSLRPKNLNREDADLGRVFCEQHNLQVVMHTPYVANLSTPRPDLYEFTVRSVLEDLHISEIYGAVGAVVHCGKHVGEGVPAGKSRMVETLNAILASYNGPVKLLLENTAGQGTELGTTLAELVELCERTDYPEKIGFCFDTCHAFAAGSYHPEQLSALITEMKQSGYLDNLVAIHFNDSKCAYNSRRDRHEKIGQGEIGDLGLCQFLQAEEFGHLPVILETPVQDESEYAVEIEMLCEWHKRKECLK